MIKELIVVEGKNDAAAVHRALPQADVLITHGWGLKKDVITALKVANKRRGVIVFTDPDRVGDDIRRRLASMLPGCRHAFLPRSQAQKNGRLGVETATCDDILAALAKVRSEGQSRAVFSQQDLLQAGLTGTREAAARREALGAKLAIGYGNSKNFLWRLNALGVTRAEFAKALAQMEAETNEQKTR